MSEYKIVEPLDMRKLFEQFTKVVREAKTKVAPIDVANDIALLHAEHMGIFNYTTDALEAGKLPVMTAPAALEFLDDCMVVIEVMLVAWGEDRARAGLKDDLSGVTFPEPVQVTAHTFTQEDVDVDSAQVEAYGKLNKEDIN